MVKKENTFSFYWKCMVLIGGAFSAVITMIIQFHHAEVASLNAQISTLKSENSLMEKMSCDIALARMEGQKKIFEDNNADLQKRIQMIGTGQLEFDDFTSQYLCLKLNPSK